MRRRFDESAFPPGFLVFDGRDLKTERAWMAEFEAFNAARRRWWRERGLPEEQMPDYECLSYCPFDPNSI